MYVVIIGNMKKNTVNEVLLFQAKTGAIEFKSDLSKETLWATQAQIMKLFNVDQSVVSRHIKNIFQDREVHQKSNMQKMHNAFSDKPVILYSLDLILAVGYRANSGRAIQFRQWATKTLRSHIVDGYTINKKRIGKNYEVFLKAVDDIKKLLPSSGVVDAGSVMELVKMFASTWLSLDSYDKAALPKGGVTKKKIKFTGDELHADLTQLKHELMRKGEATDLFATTRGGQSFQGIVGNIFQTFGGKDLYPTVEEKAAHLLYFVVKNHPFVDGNKRSGAFSFVWFLRQARILNIQRLTPEALTALTLLIAESNPSEKEKMVGLVLLLLN